MRAVVKFFLPGLIVGLLYGFLLFGLEVLPKTVWRWSFGDPIELSGNIAAPMLIRLPSGVYYYVLDYERCKDVWYLYDYRVHDSEHTFWTGSTHVPLTLGMSNSYEVVMLPPDRYSSLWGPKGYIPDSLQLYYIEGQGWFVSDNSTYVRLREWLQDKELEN